MIVAEDEGWTGAIALVYLPLQKGGVGVITDTLPVLSVAWSDVSGSVSTFLGSALVIGALAAVLAVRFIPKFLRAVRSVMR